MWLIRLQLAVLRPYLGQLAMPGSLWRLFAFLPFAFGVKLCAKFAWVPLVIFLKGKHRNPGNHCLRLHLGGFYSIWFLGGCKGQMNLSNHGPPSTLQDLWHVATPARVFFTGPWRLSVRDTSFLLDAASHFLTFGPFGLPSVVNQQTAFHGHAGANRVSSLEK